MGMFSDLLSRTPVSLPSITDASNSPLSDESDGRRAYPRYLLDRGVIRILDESGPFLTCGQVNDVGADGLLFFALTNQLHESQRVQINFALPTFGLNLPGVVLRSVNDYYSIAFRNIGEDTRRLLNDCFAFEAEFGPRVEMHHRVLRGHVAASERPCGSACALPRACCLYLP